MAQYVLMLRDSGFPTNLSPTEIQAILQRYKAWSQKAGQFGMKLTQKGGRVLRNGSVTDGPYVEAKEVLGGLMVIDASSFDEAVRLCADHPHREFGSIEIREIELMRDDRRS